MTSEAQNAVASKSKEQALLYYNSGNFGRAFAHFLVVLKLIPEWKRDLKIKFSAALCAWGEQLESQQRFKDLFNCYEQALEIFPENEEVYSNLGAHLFRLGHLHEAAHYFRQALEINKNYLPAYRNLQSVSNALVERWHFRMLNDTHRNEAFREAILKKVRQGFISLLDIGTGTGILSLYAVSSGVKEIHACDYSSTMCTIAQEVLKANKVDNRIRIINKLSNNLTIPADLPQRKSLVVTETLDSGLLGEHIMQTLLHAWGHLLKPPCPQLLKALDDETPIPQHGVVVPFGARLFAAAIKCPSIAQRQYLTEYTLHQSPWSFKNVWLHNDSDEPYDSESLKNFSDCKFMSEPVEVFNFDFNNPEELKKIYNGENDGNILYFSYEGKADALAVWYDLMLDEDITVSSSPFSLNEGCCWDQAIFKFEKPQESMRVKANCKGGKLVFEVIPQSNLSFSDENLTNLRTSLKTTNILSEIAVGTEMILFLNNKKLQRCIYNLGENFDSVSRVLDLSPFPTLGLRLLQVNGAELVSVLKTEDEVTAVKEFALSNNLDCSKIKCLLESDFDDLLSNNCEQFHLIISNIISPSGELKESHINYLPRLWKILANGGIVAPVSLIVMCQLIDSDWMIRTSRVVNEELEQTYRIAEYINVYAVSQQLDVDLRNTPNSCLSQPKECLELSVKELGDDCCITKDFSVTAVQAGSVSGIALWYQYRLCPGGEILSTFAEDSHIRQVVFNVDPLLQVQTGDIVDVNVTYHSGIIRLKVIL